MTWDEIHANLERVKGQVKGFSDLLMLATTLQDLARRIEEIEKRNAGGGDMGRHLRF